MKHLSILIIIFCSLISCSEKKTKTNRLTDYIPNNPSVIISAPSIREPIIGGSGQITGNFTFQSATDLALLLRSGALPAPLNIIEERTVGPDLGQDSINSGIISLIIGFSLVIIFMVIRYKIFGLIANAALIVNLFLLVGILTIFEATLTLPGIAGIILTVGMAVDANVLISQSMQSKLNTLTPVNASSLYWLI